ncbi:MAG: cupin domain-containing protein [Kitasatospora sp.]|jgi:mannose-6-phosphate isomerase-like protein (cupin superfamily)|nr:cupin domain-containing protein [Kitasatospora sp.]
MPVIHAAETVIHDMHGSRFTSYAAPARGSTELCAWRLDVPAGSEGTTHSVSREEILFVLGGTLLVTLGDGPDAADVACRAGDAIVVPPGSSVRVANPGDDAASAWVTTSGGLEAVLPDGSRLSPPWVR